MELVALPVTNRRVVGSVGRVRVVDPGSVANLYGLWYWVGMAPRMGPESRSCTFPLDRPVSRKAGK